jgi:uncharacterized membrane-anchored protein
MYVYAAALVVSLVTVATADALDPNPDSSEDAEFGWFLDFDWQTEPGVYAVSGANATFTLGHDEVALFGAEAGRFTVELEGAESFRDIDAVILKAEGPLANSMIALEHIPFGFVRDNDWHELNSDELLEIIREQTSRDNAARIGKGHAPVELLGWSQPPTFDSQNKVAYWAIKAQSESNYVINASAIRLSRDGFTRITWIGEPNQFLNARSALDPAIARYDYDQGWRYADFRAGDAVAGIGIAALTRQMVTGRTGKAVATAVGAGIMATAAILAKKLWFLIFLPFVALWHLLKRRSKA